MQTVIELSTFIKAAEKAGLKESDVAAIVLMIAKDPDAGDAIVGSGGCRKVRVAGRGKGKSGGYRLITFYSGMKIPAFLITLYSKGELGNLSDAQVNTLKSLTTELKKAYRTT